MARPKRSNAEMAREGMKSSALMNEYAQRINAANPHQFAVIFDKLTGLETETSGSWRLNFSGHKVLSTNQRRLLSLLDNDVEKFYQNGPSDIWLAMWGDPSCLWSLCRTRLSNDGPFMDERTWSTLQTSAAFEQPLEIAVSEFEGEVLLCEAYAEPLTLRHLTEAVALYRLIESINFLAKIRMDKTGICRCIRVCLEDPSVKNILNRFSVLQPLTQAMTNIIDTPEAMASADHRWRVLAERLPWVG